MHINEGQSAKEWAIPLILFISGLILRLYSAVVPGIIVPDGIMYINTAKLVEAGEWGKIAQYSFYNLYPFLIVVFHKAIANWELSARILSVLAGSLAVVPFYWIIKRLFTVKLAIVASIFFVISPRLIEYSSNVIREPVFWFFALSALCAAMEAIRKTQYIYMILSALLVGLAAFTRMEGLALIPIIMFWSFWQYRQERRFRLRAFIIVSLVFLVSFPVLFISPLVFVKARLGHWEFGHIGSKIPQILSAARTVSEETFQQSVKDSDVVTRIVSGNKYLVFTWQSIFKFFRSYHVLFIMLFIIGITRRKVIPYSSQEIFIWAWWLGFFVVSLLYISKTYYLSTRHGMLMGLPGLVWVSIGIFEVSGLLEKWGISDKLSVLKKSRNGIVILTISIICAVVLPSSLSWSGADKVEMKKAGIFLKQTGYSDGKLAVEGRLNRLGFYSGADYVTVPDGTTPVEISRFLRSAGIDYLVIDRKTMGNSMAVLISDPENNLKKIDTKEYEGYKNYSFVLFSVKRE